MIIKIIAEIIVILALICIVLILLAVLFSKDCPKCRGIGRIYKTGMDYICPVCKGTRTVFKIGPSK